VKTQEKALFKFCIWLSEGRSFEPIPTYLVIDMFVKVFGYNEKQLYYYVDKWVDKGIVDYGTSIRNVWFEFENLSGAYLDMYNKIFRKEGGVE
jgi:hypothetical protein